MRDRTKDWIGRGVVGAVLAAGIVLTGCGDDRESVSEGTSPRLPRAPATVQPAAVVTDTPVAGSPAVTVVAEPVDYATAETAWREGRYGDAVRLFERYVNERPDNPWGHYMLGLAARRTGDGGLAERSFAAALVADPAHVKSQLNLARVLLDGDRPDEALTRVEQVLERDPVSIDALRLRGVALAGLGREADAIAAYRQALLVDPADGWTANNLGLLHIRAGRYAEALGPLARAVTVAPGVTIFRNNLGVALERTGHLSQAVEQYGVAADSGHATAGASRDRVAARVTGDEPVVNLVVAGEEFLERLTGGTPPPPSDTTVVPGETIGMTRLWEDVLARWGN